MMMLSLSKKLSIETSIWKLSPLFVRLNGLMSTSTSGESAEVKWLSDNINFNVNFEVVLPFHKV